PLAQGRGIRQRADGEGNPHGLRRRRGAAAGGAGRRHRLPHRPPFVLLQPAGGRPVGGDRPGPGGSRAALPEGSMKTIPPNPGEPATAPAAASTAASTAPPSGQAGAQPGPAASPLDRLAEVIESRRGADPDGSYVARLLARGEDAILKKI